MKSYHEKATINSKFRLLKNVMRMRLEEDGDMEAHLSRINESFQQLVDLGMNLTVDDWKSAAMLGSLPDSYDNIVTLMEMRPENEITASNVQAKLIDEHRRRLHKDDATSQGAALMTSRHQHKRPQQKAKELFCFKCKQKGHFKSECPDWQTEGKKNNNPRRGNGKTKANLVKEGDPDSENYLFLTSSSNQGGWIIDSGATSHI